MANHHALQLVEHDDFPKMMLTLSHEDWRTMQEMEAVYEALEDYAMDESQMSVAFMSSLKPYY